MSDNLPPLVERLRHEAFHTGYKPAKPWDLLVEAADAIERLQAQLEAAVAAERERCAKHVADCAIPGHSSLGAFTAAHQRIINGTP